MTLSLTKKNEFVECVIDTNAKTSSTSLTQKSGIIRPLVEENKVKIVAAKYDLDDGIVTLFK